MRAEKARRRLSEFVRQAWHVVEPSTLYVHGWHIDAICEHLQAVTSGDIRNLIINIPPRHMKSLLVSVFWPTWVWTKQPETRWLFGSYAESLAIRDSVKCRRIIQSPWYQRQFGHMFKLTGDANLKQRFENDKTGYRVATGVGGSVTGEGGDFLVADDPIKAQDARSDAVLDACIEWWDGAMSTRGNDPKTVARVITMQRLVERDLTGHTLDKMRRGGTHYEQLILPAEYEPRVWVTGLGWKDPRTEPGELLWPERFGPAELAQIKSDLEETGVGPAGQLQQRPAPAGGAIYQKDWWKDGRNRYDPGDRAIINRVIARWLFLDTAYKDKDSSDFTACSVVEMLPDYRIVWREVWRKRLLFPTLVDEIESTAKRYNVDEKLQAIVIEDRASGTSAIQTLQLSTAAWLSSLIVPFNPQGDKAYRARQASLWCERDCVLLPIPSDAAAWLFDFFQELTTFPASAHDDMADTFSMGIIYLENYLAAGWQARNGQTL